jgi:hypothetical protein
MSIFDYRANIVAKLPLAWAAFVVAMAWRVGVG